MEVHPRVLALMEKHAASPEQLRRLIAHHHSVTIEQVERAMAEDEEDDYRDAVGWD